MSDLKSETSSDRSLADLRSVEPEEITASDLAPYMPWGMSIYYRPIVPVFPLPAPAPAHPFAGAAPLALR
jgi:hypothetical protein